MEHTLAYVREDVIRERRRAEFLLAAVKTYAPHVVNDIQQALDTEYPQARLDYDD